MNEKPLEFSDDDFQFFGIRRGGNHAISEWILPHFKGNVTFVNNVILTVDGPTTDKGNFSEIKGDVKADPVVFMGFEDVPLDVARENLKLTNNCVMVLRDPFNTFASRLKRIRESRGTVHETALALDDFTVSLWKQYANEFLGKTNYLNDAVCVNYNKWLTSKDYRKELSSKFGENHTDKGFGVISKYTHGSSFDEFKYQNQAAKMDLSNRWKLFLDDEEFLSLFDEEIISLSNEIFGNIAPDIKPYKGLYQKRLIKNALATAKSLYDKENKDKAKEILEQILKIDSKNLYAKEMLQSIRVSSEPKEVLKELESELKENPDDALLMNNIATTYSGMGDVGNAIKYAEKAVAIEENPYLINNLGHLRSINYEFDKAEDAFVKAIDMQPYEPRFLSNLGKVYMDSKQPAKAIRTYSKLLAMYDKQPGIKVNVSYAKQMQGNMQDAWEDYENRLLHFDQHKTYMEVFGKSKIWDGKQDLNDKSILVYCEQGIGDAIHFIRYLYFLKAKYEKASISILCAKALSPVFDQLGYVDNVYSKEDHYKEYLDIDYDLHLPLLSLPLLLDMKDQIPHVPYLPKPRITSKRIHIKNNRTIKKYDGLNVGICWKGSELHPNNAIRSIDLDRFFPIADIPNINVYSLQHKQIDLSRTPVTQLDINDFSQLAYAMLKMDIIISIDSAPLHLAGAYKFPCIGLLAYISDWRWGTNERDTNWYPSMRLIRQPSPGNWDAVFDELYSVMKKYSDNYKKPHWIYRLPFIKSDRNRYPSCELI